MKLWNQDLQLDTLIEQFTVGEDRVLDLQLAEFDLRGSIAHARMLASVGLLTEAEAARLVRELEALLVDVSNGKFTIEPEFEDVHSKVEHVLTERLGEVGKKIHTARSRNDQVLVDLHLFSRAKLDELDGLLHALFDRLLQGAATHRERLIPGYTHTQVAMPSSIGLWLSGYAETLLDDRELLRAARRVADQNPLGSAAGYGSSFPIDRELTTELLGFRTTRYSAVGAQLSRGKLELTVAFALASIGETLAKLCADAILFMSQNFGFIGLPTELTTGSSIMPHKRNPDVFEIGRARANELRGLPQRLQLLTGNLTSGYHRDFQELKGPLLHGFARAGELLRVLEFTFRHLEVRPPVLGQPIYDHLFSVELVNELVLSGMSFRDAYHEVKRRIAAGTYDPPRTVAHTHVGSIGNLALDRIRAKWA